MKNFRQASFTFLTLIMTLLLIPGHSFSQITRNKSKKTTRPTLNKPVYYQRNAAHYAIDKIQQAIDRIDGNADSVVSYFGDDKLDGKFTAVIFDDVDDYQIYIENDTGDNYKKLQDLDKLQKVVQIYEDRILHHDISKSNFDELMEAYEEMYEHQHDGKMTKYINSHINQNTADLNFMIDPEEPGLINLMGWYCYADPERAINNMSESWDKPYADTMVSILAPKYKTKFLAYAQSYGSKSREVVGRNKTPEVQVLYKIATESNSRNVYKNFIFFDAIAKGTMSIEEADKISNDKNNYFQNMVNYRLQNDYLSNTKEVLKEIKVSALEKYVRVINELHDKPSSVRFKCLQPLTPEELYYVAVSGSQEIYTSSFLGLYKLMMQKWGDQSSSALLDTVHYDKFRTFIRMASGYNEINDFMDRMSEGEKKSLITRFVSDLEKNIDQNGLEDAVDVADSYGSIKDKDVQNEIKSLIEQEYQRTRKEQNTKGMAIYSILLNVIEGNSKLIAGENVLNLPPVLDMPIDKLKDDDGYIYAVMFFYGDEDGRGSFNTFSQRLRSAGYSIKTNKDWISATSSKNPKFVVYINQPHEEPEDEKAQNNMMRHLHDRDIHPSILVHRGHSYHVSLSIDQMESSNKIVVLGSCGGYHNLKSILEKSKDAQIVSSKQTGVGVVNNRIIEGLFRTIENDKNVEWIPLWSSIKTTLKSSPEYLTYFEDYIPPYMNLGAIFVSSYYKLVGQLEASDEEL